METSERFSWIEYTTLGSLLSIPMLIGIYYGCIKANQNTVKEYMHGGKNMRVLPIALSLIATHNTPVSIMGYPAETYEYGLQIMMEVIGTLTVIYFINEFLIPVFYDLQFLSIFKYLELRFSKTVRKIASFVYITGMILYLPIVVYVPALAFQQVTGTEVHTVIMILTASCVFYTSIGGLKTVVWSSTIYTVFNIGVLLVVVVLGLIKSNGLSAIYDANARNDRWDVLNLDPSPYMRVTVWSASLGAFVKWIHSIGINAGAMQRFTSLPSRTAAKWTVFLDCLGISVMVVVCSLLGLLIYAYHDGCDPLRAKTEIQKSAELLPHYVQKIASSFPGLTGVFVSGIIGASQSAMSAGLNTIAGLLYEDFISGVMPRRTTEKKASTIMKIIVIILGFLCVGVVYVVERLGTLMDMGYSLCASQNAALVAVFTLGLFFPSSNTIGAICGMISSLLFTAWVIVGRQLAMTRHHLVYQGKASRIDACPLEWNITTTPLHLNLTTMNSNVLIHPETNSIYAVSFLYLTLMGAIVGTLVGLAASILTGGNDLKQLNPKLIVPILRKYLPQSLTVKLNDGYKLAPQKELLIVEKGLN